MINTPHLHSNVHLNSTCANYPFNSLSFKRYQQPFPYHHGLYSSNLTNMTVSNSAHRDFSSLLNRNSTTSKSRTPKSKTRQLVYGAILRYNPNKSCKNNDENTPYKINYLNLSK